MIEIDYQVIVNITADIVRYALPIGVVFGLAEKIVNMFLSMAFGEKNIKM